MEKDREGKDRQAAGAWNLPLYILAGVITCGVFALTIGLFMFTIPEGNDKIAYILFGAFASNFGMVVAYFFGSSMGSHEKTVLMAAHSSKINEER